MNSPLAAIPDEIRRELLSLRKGHGMTVAKLAESPQLLALCRCDQATARVAEAVLVEVVRTLPVREDREALLNALAIGIDPGEDLDDRRKRFGALRSRHWRTVERWENRALGELYQALLRRFAGGYDCALTLAHESVLVEHRVITHKIESRTLLALEDGVDSFAYRIASDANVTPLTGDRWEVDVDNGVVKLYVIWFPKPLQRGQTYTWRFHVRYPPTPAEGDEVSYCFQQFGPTTAHYHLDVQFRGERPVVCWYFDQQPIELVEAGRYKPDELLVPDKAGIVSRDFRYLSGAAETGIAWQFV